MITGLYLPDGNGNLTTDLQAMAYRYDQLNRIREAQSFDNFSYSSQTWGSNAGGHDDYHALYTGACPESRRAGKGTATATSRP